MAENPLNDKEIIELISKLREETPEYPSELQESRKAGFLEQVAEFKDSGDDRGGKSKSGGGGTVDSSEISWSASGALGGGSATSEFSTQSALVLVLLVVVLALAYLFRDQIVDYLVENDIITVEETATPTLESLSIAPTETPTAFDYFSSDEPTLSATRRADAHSSGTAATPGAPGVVNDNRDGVPVTGNGGSEPTKTTLPPHFSQPTVTSTPSPPDNSIYGRLRYIMCILQGGGENCP